MTKEMVEKIYKEVKDRVLAKNPESTVELERIPKNHGISNGISYRRSGSNVSAITYLDDFDETDGYETLVEEIAEVLLNNKPPEQVRGNFIEEVRAAINDGHVWPCLIGNEENAKYLEDKKKTAYLNMSCVYKVKIGEGMYIAITDRLADLLGLDDGNLKELGHGTMEQHVKVRNMNEMLGFPGNNESGLTIGTNDSGFMGAAIMMYPDLLDMVAAKAGSEIIKIMPSSIHEVIAVPDSMWTDSMAGMVREINEKEVKPEDRLTNSVYEYDSAKKCVCMVYDGKEMCRKGLQDFGQ